MTDTARPLFPGWPPRDMLVPFVLLAVSMKRAHGYLIEEYLRTLGLMGVDMSTLYRTLRQMEKDGLLRSAWEPGATGPGRRVYTPTDAGLAWLDASAATLQAYRDTIDRFFGLRAAREESTMASPRPKRTRPRTATAAHTRKPNDEQGNR